MASKTMYSRIFLVTILCFFFNPSSFTHNQQEYLAPPVIVDLPDQFKNNVDISILIADMKFNGDSIKIFELGNITNSILVRHETIHGKRVIWKRIYNYLQNLGLQVYCVGNPIEPRKAKYKCFTNLSELGAYKADTLKQLKTSGTCNAKNKKRPQRLNEYQGVLALERHNRNKNKAKKLFPHCLLLNNIAYEYGSNKYKTAILFTQKELAPFKPKWKVYPKVYSNYIVNKIKNDFTEDVLVIKPIDGTLGKGVIMVHRNDLDETLKKIFTQTSVLKNMPDTSYNHWAKDTNKIFLIESYEPSKHLVFNNRPYDATMRVIFALSCYDGKLHVNFLGSYYKTALKALDADCSLTKKHKSKSCNERIAKVPDNEAAQVQELMSYILPHMYIKMMEVNKNMPLYLTKYKKINRQI